MSESDNYKRKLDKQLAIASESNLDVIESLKKISVMRWNYTFVSDLGEEERKTHTAKPRVLSFIGQNPENHSEFKMKLLSIEAVFPGWTSTQNIGGLTMSEQEGDNYLSLYKLSYDTNLRSRPEIINLDEINIIYNLLNGLSEDAMYRRDESPTLSNIDKWIQDLGGSLSLTD